METSFWLPSFLVTLGDVYSNYALTIKCRTIFMGHSVDVVGDDAIGYGMSVIRHARYALFFF